MAVTVVGVTLAGRETRSKEACCLLQLLALPFQEGRHVTTLQRGMLFVTVVGVTLAGRETRYKEECCFSAREICTLLADKIHENYGDKPFFFFGHR